MRAQNLTKILAFLLISYLSALLLFVFFPRPILLSGDANAIAEFLRTHNNFFYRIIYADSNKVAIGNYLMLTIPTILLTVLKPNFGALRTLISGAALSAFIELAQFFIPGRVPDMTDWISNVASVAIGLTLAFLYKTVIKTKQTHI